MVNGVLRINMTLEFKTPGHPSKGNTRHVFVSVRNSFVS